MRFLNFTVAVLFVLAPLRAQQPPKIEFDVVSVKPGDPLDPGQYVRMNPGLYRANNITLESLLGTAYQLHDYQIIGNPDWFRTGRWNIEAKFPADAPRDQFPQRMQALLADRFHMAIHRETRTLPIYTLSVAKDGPKLPAPTEPAGSMSVGARMIRYSSATMTELASQLSSFLGRDVVDGTGLTGTYKIDLKFLPVDPSSDVSESGPTIFTALQEQLGLKLESTRGPVEVVIIDKIEKPSEN